MNALASFLTSRRGAWLAIVAFLLVVGGASGALRGVEAPPRAEAVPTNAESVRAAEAAKAFPGADKQSVLVVLSRDGQPMTDADRGLAEKAGSAVATSQGTKASPVIPAEDGKALMVSVPVTPGADGSASKAVVAEVREKVRSAIGDQPGLRAEVTGGPAFAADIASAFNGANLRLLLVTVGIVAVLLLLTYRSPVLMLVPLAVVASADGLAGAVTKGLGAALDLSFDSGIVSVLVFGAGTNYALLLVSRYREELRRTQDHRAALRDAWRATLPAILASNLTVVLSLAVLLLATVPGTRGLGLASAAGLLIALVAAVLVLPAALSLLGRKAFWPLVPRVGSGDAQEPTGIWATTARFVLRHRVAVAAATLAMLGVLATGLVGAKVGLPQADRFTVASESAAGLKTLSAHYPAGEAQPATLVMSADKADAVAAAARTVPGVVRLGEPVKHEGLVRQSVVLSVEPGSDASLKSVRTLRAATHEAARDTLVGGPAATELDVRDAARADLLRIVPLVLLVVLVVLVVLLRALVAPVVLLLVNATSAVAMIGGGAWLSRELLGYPALDTAVPLVAFLFLVALGIDYTIFLVHRIRANAASMPMGPAVVEAVIRTGVVITSAGVVLAGVFAALGVLPLVTLAQLGLIVGLGVLVDTFVVRTLLIPALLELLGRRAWWPSRPGSVGGAV